MHVIRASALGMCFGVRDALAIARDVSDPQLVTIHGELVHNPAVLRQLSQAGFRQTDEAARDEAPATPAVLVTAHGISDKERTRLQALGKTLIDTTCPLVRRAHAAAQLLAREGYHVIVIGRPGHVEVQGIVEDLPAYTVVSRCEDVEQYPESRLGVICQTTTPPRIAAAVLQEIERRNPHAEVRFINTICQPTLDRQLAVELLCLEAGVIVVVGGPNSNNTQQLVELARECGSRAYRVESAGDLRTEWFAGCDTVGLTAGTSALEETVCEVESALESLGSVRQMRRWDAAKCDS